MDYFRTSKNRQQSETLQAYILCDCSVAIDIIVNRLLSQIPAAMFQRLSVLDETLSQLKVDIILAWIPGHHQIEFNETANCLAKETAPDVYAAGRLCAPLSDILFFIKMWTQRQQPASIIFSTDSVQILITSLLMMQLKFQLKLQEGHDRLSGIKIIPVITLDT